MHFSNLRWPAVDEYRGLDAATCAAVREELLRVHGRLVRTREQLIDDIDPSRRSGYSSQSPGYVEDFSAVVDQLDRALRRASASDDDVVLEVVGIFAEMDRDHVGNVEAKYAASMAECDDDGELEDEPLDISERAWDIGFVAPGRFEALVAVAAALVAPRIPDPNQRVADARTCVDQWERSLGELANAEDGWSARRLAAVEIEVRSLRDALTLEEPVVETLARLLEVAGPLRWYYAANDLRLEYLSEGWGDESTWDADEARYDLMVSIEGALGVNRDLR